MLSPKYPFEQHMEQKLRQGDRKLWDNLDPESYEMDPVVRKLTEKLPKKSSIFEYGAGRGRNALPLAELGYAIDVQDIWGSALEALEARAKSQKLTIGIEKSDASEHRLKQQYDALICMRLLHFLKIADGWSIIKNMQNNTNEGGWNAYSFFIDITPHKPEFFYPSIIELQEYYTKKGWTIEIQSEICPSKPEETLSGKIMYQKSILFHKPKSVKTEEIIDTTSGQVQTIL